MTSIDSRHSRHSRHSRSPRLCALAGILAGLAWLAVPHASARADDQDGDEKDDDEKEEKIAFASAPAAVQAAFKRQAGAATPARLERETEHGVRVYEGDYKLDGRKLSLSVAENGEVVELEEDIALDRLPPAVRAAAERALPGSVVKEAEAVHLKGGAAIDFYEVEVKAGKHKTEFKIKPSGEILP